MRDPITVPLPLLLSRLESPSLRWGRQCLCLHVGGAIQAVLQILGGASGRVSQDLFQDKYLSAQRLFHLLT